jgi:hypothetical protein
MFIFASLAEAKIAANVIALAKENGFEKGALGMLG